MSKSRKSSKSPSRKLPKPRNPQDATLRNIRALTRRVFDLELAHNHLSARLDAVEKAQGRIDG